MRGTIRPPPAAGRPQFLCDGLGTARLALQDQLQELGSVPLAYAGFAERGPDLAAVARAQAYSRRRQIIRLQYLSLDVEILK